MFDNVGGKIKVLAKVICWIGIVASAILSLVMFVTAADPYESDTAFCVLLGFLFLIGGTIGSWISSLFIYGFGELIEKTSEVEQNTRPVKPEIPQSNYFTAPEVPPVEPAVRKTTAHTWRCKNCGGMTSRTPCEICGFIPATDK